MSTFAPLSFFQQQTESFLRSSIPIQTVVADQNLGIDRLQQQLQRTFSIFDTASTELRAAVVGAAATISALDTPRIDAEIVEHAAVERGSNQQVASVSFVGNSAEEPASDSIQYTAVAERQTSQ
jgi:hypothetical protein